ncbi:hypothetical protein A5733_22180 [Mycobacterium sp. NS-7484]|uniref:hypothetical protein n=1 Tax=Mycobacterium sp. NS-7484 TaxID=1834161 RepID=UPI00096FA482|nr:hypothetical protein [Mycobacterium sp. NS-7484]OMC04010.1 hypothetical protein A5733_22180 [Mycobacterium sp. NS-7484]
MPSTDIATVEDSSLDILPPAQAPSAVARHMLREHAAMMQDAYQLAKAVCSTQMVPTRFRGKPEDGAAAIMYGSELGLNPLQSLQKVVPVHGMPSLEARTMVALLKARGYRVKTTAQSDTSVTVQGIDLDGDVYESTWTIDRAKKAGYVPMIDEKTGKYKTNKNGNLLGNEKYLTDPQAMLKAKAQSEVCRDMAPDVLMGISYTSEELESENWDNGAALAQAQVQAPKGRGAVLTTDDILADEVPDPTPEPEVPQDAARATAVRRTKEHLAAGTMPDPNEDIEAAEAYAEEALTDDEALTYLAGAPETGHDGGNEQSRGAEPSSGSTPESDPADQDTSEPEPVAPAAEPEPAPARKVSSRRAALERRLFKLLAGADVDKDNREDRLIIYRAVIGRADIQSTNDLTDVEIATLCDQLYEWDRDKTLGDKVTDILNNATLAADSE